MSTYPDVFIVGAARTPIGKFLGGLAPLKPADLGAIAIKEAMSRASIGGKDVDEVLMGHVVQAGRVLGFLVQRIAPRGLARRVAGGLYRPRGADQA